MVVQINRERVKAVGNAVAALGLEPLLELEEKFDPQYSAMQRLAASVGRGVATAYAMLVALVSYRMTMRGEQWWACASDMLSTYARPSGPEDIILNVIRFLDECPGSALGREQKKRRLARLRGRADGLLSRLMSDPSVVIESPGLVLEELSKAMGSPEYKKTITFAVKMAYYAAREPGSREPLRYQAPMPIDVRVSCLTLSSGLVTGVKSYRDLVREPRPAQEAWSLVSQISGIPVPHLDSLAWLTGWAPRDLPTLSEARRAVEEVIARVAPRVASLVAKELVQTLCH